MTDGDQDGGTSEEVANSTAQTTESQRDADPSRDVAETTAEMKSIDLSNTHSGDTFAP